MTINYTKILGLAQPADNDTNWGQSWRDSMATIDDLFASFMFAQDTANTTGLTFAHKGGTVAIGNGVGNVAAGTVALTDNATNYVEAYINSGTVAVATNTTGFTLNRIPLYEVVTASGAISTITDVRSFLGRADYSQDSGKISNVTVWNNMLSQDTSTTTGLNYGYTAGTVDTGSGVINVAAGTVALADGSTNYVEMDGTGTVSSNTTGFTAGRIPMAEVVTENGSAQWAASTTHAAGDAVYPSTANGLYYKAENAGYTGTTEPTWPTTVGETVQDDAGAADWVANNAYAANAMALPRTANGFYYEGTAGTSAGTEPVWPTAEGATIADDADATTWVAGAVIAQGLNVTPTTENGWYYTATTGGTTGTTEPTWPTTEGATVTDGTVTWTAHQLITWTAHQIITWQAVAKITTVTDKRTWISASGNAVSIQGMPVLSPTSANDQQFLQYDATNREFKYANGSSGGGGGGLPALVDEITPAAGATSIAFTNLKGIQDGGYVLIVEALNADTTQQSVSLFVNGDTTATDYNDEATYSNASTTVTNNTSDSIIGEIPANGSGSLYSVVDIGIVNGQVYANANANYYASTVHMMHRNIYMVPSQTDITSLELQIAGTAGFASGSKFSLYRRNTTDSSAPKAALVQEIDVSATTTSVTFDNLSAVADGGYVLELTANNPSSSTETLLLYFNGDETNANYKEVSANFMSSYGQSINSQPNMVGINSNEEVLVVTNIALPNSGKVQYISNFSRPTVQMAGQYVGQYTVSVSDITSITISGSVSNGIGAGSKFRLYRRNTSIVDANNATKLQGMPFSLPGSAQDGQTLAYNDANQSMEWRSAYYTGTYVGNGVAQTVIQLPFKAVAIFVQGNPTDWASDWALAGQYGVRVSGNSSTANDDSQLTLAADGMSITVDGTGNEGLNYSGTTYHYLAIRA